MVSLGLVVLGVVLLSTVTSIAALIAGHGRKRGGSLSGLGYWGTYVSAGALTIAILLLVVAFFAKDYSFMYVAENHSPDVSRLAWLYSLSALWAGREGSFLLWAWFLSLFAAWIAYRRFRYLDALSNMGLMVTNVVLGLFAAGMLFSEANNPFKTTPAAFLDANGGLVGEALGWGMNPLLQHWAMILHPPALFIGYAGLTIPFAFAVATLIVNDGSDAWVRIVDRITVFSWLLLGAGIGLGSVWAYVELSFGGYWAWDPVENASLLPWLTGVALLHSFTVYRKRGGFKKWAVALASVTFALVILGTFITRSGIVQSVHGFQPDKVSLYLFLSMIVAGFLVAAVGPLLRRDTLAGNDDFESLTGKEAAYYFNNVIMLVAGLLVAYLTVTSALPTWMVLGGRSMPAATYDSVGRPLGVLYVFIIALCPLLSWRRTDVETLWGRLRWPLIGAGGIFALLMVVFATSLLPIYTDMIAMPTTAGQRLAASGSAIYYNTVAVLGLLAASLLIATTTSVFVSGARKRVQARGGSFSAALWSILTKARSQSGGYVAHIGMGIVLIGLVGSSMYVFDDTVTVARQQGATFTAEQYTFTYIGPNSKTLSNGNTIETHDFDVSRGGRTVGRIKPGQTVFPAAYPGGETQTRTDARVLSEPLRDVFMTLQGVDASGITVNVKVNPLIWFTWCGFVLLLVGTTVAVWPRKKR